MHRSLTFTGAMLVLFALGFARALVGHDTSATDYLVEVGIVFGLAALATEAKRLFELGWARWQRYRSTVEGRASAEEADSGQTVIPLPIARHQAPEEGRAVPLQQAA